MKGLTGFPLILFSSMTLSFFIIPRDAARLRDLAENCGRVRTIHSVVWEWIKMGIYGMQDKKGAERLMNRTTPTLANTNNFDLNVELRQDGGAVVAPPGTPPPAPAQK